MKILILAAYVSVSGSAPFCTYDGHLYQCFYYSWAACEMAAQYQPYARCVVHP